MSGFPSWAYVGAKVVKIDAPATTIGVDAPYHAVLDDGQIFTIRDVLWSGFFSEPYLLLQEIRHRPERFSDSAEPYEWGYLIRYFAPLVSAQQKKDISEHFKPLLTKQELVE